jgi:hypothetical protein
MSNLLEKASILLTPTAYDDGKILSVKPSIVLGEELVTNGDFATDSDWSKTNANISNGLATITVTNGGFSALSQNITYASGRKYIITAQIQGLSGSSGKQIKFQDRGNNTGGLNTSNALITLDETLQNIEISWTANSNSTDIVISRQSNSGDYSFTIDNVSIKEAIDGDFDFTRNSSATRVNSQGLIEDMQTFSGNLVSNGDFSQEGPELLSQPVNIVTDFLPNSGGVIVDADTFETFGGTFDGIRKVSFLTIGKTYRLTIEGNTTSSGFSIGELTTSGNEYGSGFGTFYFTAIGTGSLWIRQRTSGTTNITSFSVKEVGQDWTLGTGWSIGNSEAIATSGSGTANKLTQTNTLNGKYAKVSLDVSNYGGSGLILVDFGSTASSSITSNGTHILYGTYDQNDFQIYKTDSFSANITNISVIEITDDTNLPRIDYSPYSGAGTCGHWLFEPQSTNLITYSEDFSQWSVDGNQSSPTTISGLNPDGSSQVYQLNLLSGGNLQRIISVSSSIDYTFSVYIKGSGIGRLMLSNAQAVPENYVDFTATSEWQRIELTGSSSYTIVRAAIGSWSNSPASGTIQIFGAQLEQQSFATSYIPTSGSTVTRNQEEALGAGNSSLINSTEGVLYAEVAALANDLTFREISLSDGTQSNRVDLGFNTLNNNIQALVRTTNGANKNYSTNAYTITNFNKIAISYAENNFSFWVNGVKAGGDTSGNTPIGLSELAFDSGSGSAKFFGKTKCVAVFKEALTDDELECLTSDETSFSSFNALALANNYTII